MPGTRLQTILDELQQELQSTGELTEDDRAELKSLVSSLEDVLDPDVDTDHDSLVSDLKDATMKFESTHPRLTQVLASVSDLLRSMGLS